MKPTFKILKDKEGTIELIIVWQLWQAASSIFYRFCWRQDYVSYWI
jgi:hypothetical protein